MNLLIKNNLSVRFFVLLQILFLFGFVSRSETKAQTANFRFVLEGRLAKAEVYRKGKKSIGIRLDEVCAVDTDSVAARVFAEYGAIFVAGNNVRFPSNCIFNNENEVQAYQNSANPQSQNIGGTTIELQTPAMNALLEAIKEAAAKNLRISPRGGTIAAKRSYEDTVSLWNSRFFPALTFWSGRGKISRREADSVKNSDIHTQVAQVLAWESKGYYFSKDFRKSILYSVAAPGASQHLFMLALDVEQFGNWQVREILARHGWFQTVKSDLPHFTYLGVDEKSLPAIGLKAVFVGGQKFWVPNLEER